MYQKSLEPFSHILHISGMESCHLLSQLSLITVIIIESQSSATSSMITCRGMSVSDIFHRIAVLSYLNLTNKWICPLYHQSSLPHRASFYESIRLNFELMRRHLVQDSKIDFSIAKILAACLIQMWPLSVQLEITMYLKSVWLGWPNSYPLLLNQFLWEFKELLLRTVYY